MSPPYTVIPISTQKYYNAEEREERYPFMYESVTLLYFLYAK